MTITIVVEDGTGVTGANSYASLADLIAYADNRKITLPVDVEDQKVLLVKAMDYLETLRWLGVADYVETAFPRSYCDGSYDAVVPANIIKAQVVLAIAAKDIELLPAASGSSRPKKQVQVGPIQITYMDSATRDTIMPFVSQAAALLRGFVQGYAQLTAVRG